MSANIAIGTKILFHERNTNDDTVVVRRGEVTENASDGDRFSARDDKKLGKWLYMSAEGETWVRGWTGKVAIAFTRAVRAEAEKRARAKREQEKKRYNEAIKHAVERMRFAADAVKRAKLPAKYRAIAFAGLMSPMPPYMSMWPFLR